MHYTAGSNGFLSNLLCWFLSIVVFLSEASLRSWAKAGGLKRLSHLALAAVFLTSHYLGAFLSEGRVLLDVPTFFPGHLLGFPGTPAPLGESVLYGQVPLIEHTTPPVCVPQCLPP